MRLKGIDKQFWWHFGQINDSKNIPVEVSGVSGIDDPDYNDDYFERLTSKVKIIHSIYLKETDVSDEGIKHISKVQGLKSLTLMKHPKITKASLPYLNQLVDLEYLDIWRSGILLEDMTSLHQLKKLKKLYISSAAKKADDSYPELDKKSILERLNLLQPIFPECTFIVDFEEY